MSTAGSRPSIFDSRSSLLVEVSDILFHTFILEWDLREDLIGVCLVTDHLITGRCIIS